MDIKIDKKEIYIEPITSCNLKCKLCYANVINGKDSKIIDKVVILDFVNRFLDFKKDNIEIYWCGSGEVFLHKEFPSIINELSSERIEHTIMTNGTIDILDEFNTLSNINLRVSIDGPKEHHEWNRGLGTYEKSIDFCKKALRLNCKSLEIRALVTKDNIMLLEEFEKDLFSRIGKKIDLQIIPPYSSKDINKINTLSIKKSISEEADKKVIPMDKIEDMLRSKYGEKYGNLEHRSDIVLSTCVMCHGVFSCCEGIFRIGNFNSGIEELEKNLTNSDIKCRSCSLFGKC